MFHRAFTCTFGQDLLRATAVTRGWNGYRKKESAQKTLEKKILSRVQPGLEPEAFRSRIRLSTTELPPLPTFATGNSAQCLGLEYRPCFPTGSLPLHKGRHQS